MQTDRETPPLEGSHWFACRTRARSEKKVDSHLSRLGVRAYLPLLVQEHQWADRRKVVEIPVFPGYLFVHTSFVAIGDILRVPGVVKLADPNGYPTPVPENEIQSVRRFVDGVNETGVLPSPADYLEPGEEVTVMEGPFKGMRGTLIELRGRTRVAVRISALRQATSVELDRDILRVAP